MLQSKRGPYRQYLRQDEPFKSRSLGKKFRRSNKESNVAREISSATEFGKETIDLRVHQTSVNHRDNEFHSTLGVRQDCQEGEISDINLHEKLSEEPCGSYWNSMENLEEVSSSDIDYSSDHDSLHDSRSPSAGTVYDFDSNNSTSVGSACNDCDQERPVDNDPPLYEGAPLSLSSSILLTLSFVLKHRLAGQCFTDLLAVIEAHCPKPNY